MPDPPGAVLIVQSGVPDPGVLALEGERHTLGRAPHAEIPFDNPYVSRRHAEILFSGDAYYIRDLGSKNGTLVDGVRVGPEPEKLEGSETIELGEGQVVATFRIGSSTVTMPTPAPAGRVASSPVVMPTTERGLVVDARRREVFVRGERVNPPLSRKEFDVLSLLHERAGEACSKDQIAARGWPERPSGEVSDQEISQCVHRIRTRVEEDSSSPNFILSIRGYGYRLNTGG